MCVRVFVSRNAIIEVDRRGGHWGTCLQMLCHINASAALLLQSHLSFIQFLKLWSFTEPVGFIYLHLLHLFLCVCEN